MLVGPGALTAHAPARTARRLAAFLLDLVVGIGWLLATTLLAWLWLLWRSDVGSKQPADWAIYFGLIVATLWLPLWAAFSALCLVRNGQTPGLAMMAIRVVGRAGGPPGTASAILHVLLVGIAGGAVVSTPLLLLALIAAVAEATLPLAALLLLVPPLLILAAELVCWLRTPERRTLHDLIAGTRVVHV